MCSDQEIEDNWLQSFRGPQKVMKIELFDKSGSEASWKPGENLLVEFCKQTVRHFVSGK